MIETGAVTKATKMTTTENCHYRGYEILPWHLWSSWCVGVYRTRADLPSCRNPLCLPWHLGRKTRWATPGKALIAFCQNQPVESGECRMNDFANIYLNTLVPMVVELTNRGELGPMISILACSRSASSSSRALSRTRWPR